MNSYKLDKVKSIVTNRNFLTILATIAVIIGIVAIISTIFTIYKKNVENRPVILGLDLEDEVLTIDGGNRNDLLYCLNKEKKSNSCNWQNYNTFQLTEEATYYIFIKNTSNEKISKPETFKYSKIDYQEMRM